MMFPYARPNVNRFARQGGNDRSSLLVFFGGMLFCLTLTFWLPTRFPPPPASSESYLFGFNNRLFLLLLGATIVVVAGLARSLHIHLPPPGRMSESGPGGAGWPLLGTTLTLAALLGGLVYWLAAPLGGLYDGAYFIDRIHLIERGRIPFRDFEFIYGSGSLYGAVYLGRLCRISGENGYHLLWFLETMLGIVLLWLTVRWVDLPSGGKRTVLLMYSVIALLFIPGNTLNYCMLRYSLPLFGVAGLCRLDRGSGSSSRARVVLFALLIAAALLNLSPEEGIVYGLTVAVSLALRRYAAGQPFVPDVVFFLLAFAGLCLERLHAGTFSTMARFSAGAFNLPVYPGPHILLAIGAVLLLTVYLLQGHFREGVRSNVLPLFVYGMGMLPGAFGRCDPTHVFGYLMSLFICSMLLCWSWPSVWRAAILGFATFLIVVPIIVKQWIDPPILSKALLNHIYRGGQPQGLFPVMLDHVAMKLAVRSLGRERAMAKITALRNSAATGQLDPRVIFPGASAVVAVPFEYMPNKLSNYQAEWIDEGRFMGLLNVLTPGEVQQKIDELRLHPSEDLVISAEGLQSCGVRTGDPLEIRVLLQLPWVPGPKRSNPLLLPLCTYIRQNYGFVYATSPQTFGYGLMRRKRGT